MPRGRKQTAAVMDVSLDLFDELIESHAPSAGRLSATNDGLAPVNGTNAPAAHLTGNKKRISRFHGCSVCERRTAPERFCHVLHLLNLIHK